MIGPLKRLLPYALAFASSLAVMVLELVASRLVARHVGASLTVWTGVIGVILAGICLGNVLGGRLADRVPPRQAVGPLFAIGGALVLGCLWINAGVGFLPGLDSIPWDLRTVLVIALDFLVPATVLGMVGPVVAKLAVETSERSGSAIGDVYTMGAVGSIAGTFLAGYWLIYLAPTSTIVAIVAASLLVLGAALAGGPVAAILGLGAGLFLGLGSLESIDGRLATAGLVVGSVKLNLWALVGHGLAVTAAVVGFVRLTGLIRSNLRPEARALAAIPQEEPEAALALPMAPKLGDLAALAFIASLGFMALEMVAGRLVARHLGSSVYSWTSVIGVLLGGLSLGNYLGGKYADRVTHGKQASRLFLLASVAVLLLIFAETPPTWLVRNPIGYFFGEELPRPLVGDGDAFLTQAPDLLGFPWWFRVLFWTAVVFFLPALTMGTVSPVVAKLAVERSRASGRTGSAIGQVYAWGMVGSLVGTFLTGFVLIDLLGTKGLILVIATMMALAATAIGTALHAAWAGLPMGLCVIAFAPAILPAGKVKNFFVVQGRDWGLRERLSGTNYADDTVAYMDESDYYYIKISQEELDGETKRTLALDNLIHGYMILGRPERLDYDYEHIYALVTHRLMQAKAEAKADGPGSEVPPDLTTLFLGGGSYTFPRYLQAIYPRTRAEVAEIDPAVTRANHEALMLPRPAKVLPEPGRDESGNLVVEIRGETVPLGPAGTEEARTAYINAISAITPTYKRDPETGEGLARIDGVVVRFGPFEAPASRDAYLRAVGDWYTNSPYTIRTTWGDARHYVSGRSGELFDIVYGDAFNDFSVPWHLTTDEFNRQLSGLMTDQGAYMINIIDIYESDLHAAAEGPHIALQDRIEAAIGGRWRASESSEAEMADWLEEYLSVTPIRAGMAAASASAAAALLEDQKPLDATELRSLVRKSRPVRRPDLDDPAASEEALRKLAESALADLRADDVLKVFRSARVDTEKVLSAGPIRDYAPSTVLRTLMVIGDAIGLDETAAERAETLLNSLDRAAKVAETIGRAAPGDLLGAIARERLGANELFEAGDLTARRTKVIFDLTDTLRQAAEGEAAGLGGALNPEFGYRKAAHAALEVSRRLRGLHEQLNGRMAAILEAAKSDPELAAEAAAEVRRFAADPAAIEAGIVRQVREARGVGAFLGSWVETARQTFPYIYVFGTFSKTGGGGRETFVVVASHAPVDLEGLGARPGDPQFLLNGLPDHPVPLAESDMKALAIRSRGIVLTDDYAPVEDLLAPVAETRAKE